MNLPDLSYEEKVWSNDFAVIGIDEVGRGAFAGPVGIGGVVFNPKMKDKEKKELLNLGINDSKKLSKKMREELSLKIKELAQAFHVSFINVTAINRFGIGKATQMGMVNVVHALAKSAKNPYLLIDAFEIPLRFPQKAIVRGDSLSISIAAASIIAKVERDKLMVELGLKVPKYGFEENKGYGTRFHREMIALYGVSDLHRSEFCKKTLQLA